MKILNNFIVSLFFLGASASLFAQVDIDATDALGAPGADVDIFIDLTGDGATSTPSFRLLYPTDSISAVNDAQCDVSSPDISGETSVNCSAGCGSFTPPAGFDCVSYILLPANIVANDPVATTTFGPITFTIDAGAVPGSNFDVFFDDTDLVGAATNGTITVEAPAGQGFYTSSPLPGGTITFNPAVIGVSATPDQVVQVGNASPDTAFDITGVNVASPLANADAFPITVASGGNEDLTFGCTPTVRGLQMGTFEIAHDSAGGAASPVEYNFECTGLSPNVQVPAGPIALAGLTVDPDPTANITVTNPQDGFTSDANNVTAAEGAGDAQITVTTGGPTNIAPDGSFDFVVSCDSTAAGSFSRTIDITWDEPAVPRGGPGTASVQVNCDITDAVPSFASAPAAPGPLDFGTVTNGVTSAPLGIDVTNDGVGPSPDSDLTIATATADDPQFSVNLINNGPFLVGDPADGANDIEVTCTPDPGTNGPLPTGTLTVTHNGDDSPTLFDLECAGEPDGAFASTPAPGGVLNLGIVPPNTTTPEGFIDFTNTGMADEIGVSCTFNDPDGVFDFTPVPLDFTLGPGETESAGFQCTPTTPQTFEGTLSCTITGDQMTTAADYTVSCQGQPLVVPTMNQWGLIIMSLMLLMVGGLVGRRWIAAQS